MFKVSLKKFLIGVLLVLIAMIVALAYLYYLISKPIGAGTYSTAELKPLFSIYGKSPNAEDLLRRPNDVAFDGKGNIFVADSENGRVFVFDRDGRFLRQIGKRGKGAGELQIPMGVTVAKDGTTFVTDKALNKLLIFDKNGVFKKDLPIPHPMKPVVANGRLYVTTSSAIYVCGLDGRELSRLGRKGRALGELAYPFGIAVDADRIYVADLLNLRVQALATNGEPIWAKGQPPRDIMGKDRTFGLPAGLALGSDNLLYLVDSFYHRITVLTKDGKIIGSAGKQGNREGELNYPAGIASRGDGVFAIADKYNDRVQIVKLSFNKKIGRR